LLADDHVVFTDGIVRILKDHYDVVGCVGDGAQLVEATKLLRPDVIVMDISMPTLSGLEALRRLKTQHGDSKIVILTMHADARMAAEAFRLGANGFVLKQCSGDELISAIEAALHGHTYLASALTQEVLSLASSPAAEDADLTSRQREVLRLIVSGQRMKEIAAVRGQSPPTVETLKYEMIRVLKVHTTTELVRHAIERRLIAF
jgi:DNA-binding NarL/FixJ family response regulator